MGVLTSKKTVKKHMPADTTAQIYWLKNRKSYEWRDRRLVDTNVKIESDGFIEALKGQVKETFENSGDIVEQ